MPSHTDAPILPHTRARPFVRTGLDNLLSALAGDSVDAPGDWEEILTLLRSGAACGLVSNPSSVTAELLDATSAMTAAGVRLAALFGPEHGATGSAAAGEAVGSSQDDRRAIPVYSLYGQTTRPTPEMLSGLDCMIFDLQDVGVRFYTYTWTLSTVMEACAEAGIPVIVLDRPNPLGGETVEGPLLEQGLESFVGRFPIPVRHGMTSAELARLFAGRFVPGAHVLAAGMSGWDRSMYWEDTGLDWASPSPNIPTAETALIYPATCLLEGTCLSEGRGTPLPFRNFGAPWIEPDRLRDSLSQTTSSRWRAVYFSPTASKFSGIPCGGVEWYPGRVPGWREQFQPVCLGLEIVHAVHSLWPDDFEWLTHGSDRSHFDRLIGRRDIRTRLKAGEVPSAIAADWPADEDAFRQMRQEFLLYPTPKAVGSPLTQDPALKGVVFREDPCAPLTVEDWPES